MHTILRVAFDVSSGSSHQLVAADPNKKHYIIGIHMTNTGSQYAMVSLLMSPHQYGSGYTGGIFLDTKQHFGLPVSLDPPWFITNVNNSVNIWPLHSRVSGVLLYYTE